MSSEIEVRDATSQILAASQTKTRALSLQQTGSNSNDVFIEQRIETVQSLIQAAPQIAKSIRDIFVSAAETYRIAKALEFELENYKISTRTSIAKMQIQAPMISKSLDRISDRIDRVLDEVSRINPSKCSMEELAHRTELLRVAQGLNNQLTQVLVALMKMLP